MSLGGEILSHAQRVCRLYKRAVRNLEAYYDRRHIFRYRAVLLRARFDNNKCVDKETAQELLEAGERELFAIQHPIPKIFPTSPGGCAFEREVVPPDWVLDYWHPLEKAQYPEFFANREKRKQQFIKMYHKQFGKFDPSKDHH